MAFLAVIGNAGGDVIWIRRAGVIIGVAFRANRCCAGIPRGMAGNAFCGDMGPGKGEIGIVMIEAAGGGTIRVAFKTSAAVVNISAYSLVLGIHIRLQMRMAINATENAVI
jgi:hypothetical protein